MTNQIMCQCQYCSRTTIAKHAQENGWARVTLANRGGRAAYLCPDHATRYGDHGYHQVAQTKKRGTMKAHGFTFGFEMETARPTAQARAEFVNAGFMPTRDATTDCEFVSPIYKSMNPLAKKLQTFEKLMNAGEFAITENEGTHFHVGHIWITHETNAWMRRFYHSLFVPLSEAMQANPAATAALFGRDFTFYACAINSSTEPGAHNNFINLQHDKTIEFRLCKFQSAAQYMNLAHFCRDCTNAIINNFILHFNDDVPNQTEYRKHKAAIAAGKMVKLFNKYAAIAASL